jgi:hypothetical protein
MQPLIRNENKFITKTRAFHSKLNYTKKESLMLMKNCILVSLALSLVTCVPSIPKYSKPQNTNIDVIVSRFNIIEDTKNYEGPIDFQLQFAENIAVLLQKKNINSIVVDSNTKTIDAKYKIEGVITEIDPGSFAQRFWVGLGSAKFMAKAKLINLSNNQIIAEFKDSRTSRSGLHDDPILQKVCIELSKDLVGEFIQNINSGKN